MKYRYLVFNRSKYLYTSDREYDSESMAREHGNIHIKYTFGKYYDAVNYHVEVAGVK
jgi:hypothetical protein